MDSNQRQSGLGDPSPDVTAVLAAVAGMLPRLRRETLSIYLEEIFRWNPQLGVVSKRDTQAVVARLLDQSVRLWDFIVETAGNERASRIRDVIDIGSGAGFPGIVWKMLVPALHVTLVERKEKKVTFLERVVARTGLGDVVAEAADIREVSRLEDRQRSADLVVMMAVGDPSDFAEPVARLLRTPGYFCCIRAREQKFARSQLGLRLECDQWMDTELGRFVLYRTAAMR